MKTQLRIRTEYSFRLAYGPIGLVCDYLKLTGCESAAIVDRNSTFGHIAWNRHCQARSIKPIFGVELCFTDDPNSKETKKPPMFWLSLLARSNGGLREIYAAVEEASDCIHKIGRLPFSKLEDFSQDIIILSGNHGIGSCGVLPPHVFVEGNPATCGLLRPLIDIATSDNYMITPENRVIYEILLGRKAFDRPSPMHILTAKELINDAPYLNEKHFALTDKLASECNVTIAPATNIHIAEHRSLLDMCMEGRQYRQLEMTPVYNERLQHELKMIESKGFTDYFVVIADMVQYAKQHMLVGPARGSSCGSLVCFLLDITDIDPIPHGLIFERFIDVTRHDLPDIDIDFQDDKRDMVFSYLIEKYGNDRVARLGTISKYKTKTAINETATAIRLPRWEAEQISAAVVKRGENEARGNLCITDSFASADIAKPFVDKFPKIAYAARLEGHARHHGMHAAGVIITNEPISNFVARDKHSNTVHIDKYDAEKINLMKVDCLGLITLTIIADCLRQIGSKHSTLLAHPLDDDAAFKVLRDKKFCGVFQFEGRALQSLTRKIAVDRFTDIAILTALARPGPLQSGAAREWIARRMNEKPVEVLHPMMEDITAETHGLIVYQEQMMRIMREIGQMEWPDIMKLRKAINLKVGLEYFENYYETFKRGALNNNIPEPTARSIWETINTYGSYSFNKSHSVAYAMVSYWCMVLKAYHPLEFALSALRYSNDEDSIKAYLRELDKDGHTFVPFDINRSELNWTIKDNQLIGGLLNVNGIGSIKAKNILDRRNKGEELSPNQIKLLEAGKTKFDNVFEGRKRFAKLLACPSDFGIQSHLWNIADIEDKEGIYVFIGKVTGHIIRSLNETQYLVKRNNLRVPNDKWLNFTVEDDSGIIGATIPRDKYARLAARIMQRRDGEWWLFKGHIQEGFRRIYVDKYRNLGETK